ncbi:MAG: 50S ribosomal protein L24 [Spirochaetales bacterium]|nr:50S ribosomal protein L24 [Spirochaetales bacterium]
MTDVKVKLKKGDNVRVIAGKDKGKEGRILKIDRKDGRVIVEGLNMVKKSMRPQREGEKGSIAEIEAPLQISNVMILCKKCGPTRIGYQVTEDAKHRVCKKCGERL